jgi:nitrite reductase/ring-hydroxylating ferredoxin subunit
MAAAADLNPRRICASGELIEGGPGQRFKVMRQGSEEAAFVVRFRGRVHAFLNRCGHVPVELDWQQGEFFDSSGLYLICATHGALYAPDSGRCLGGRCNGKGLDPVAVAEHDGWVVLTEEGGQGGG